MSLPYHRHAITKRSTRVHSNRGSQTATFQHFERRVHKRSTTLDSTVLITLPAMDTKTIARRAAKWNAVHEYLDKNPNASLDAITTQFPWISSDAQATPVSDKPKPTSKPDATSKPARPPSAAPNELVSSRVKDVAGLEKTGAASTMYHGEHATIIPPAGAPSNAVALRTVNRAFTYSDAKRLLAHSVRDAWPAIKKYFELDDWQQPRFVALMMGQATRESTLAVDIETGKAKGYNKDSAHAYGLLQTAVTGFQGSNPQYDQEDDVPEMHWYAFTPENFYDAMISNFVGIRKMCHFALQARTKYKVTDKWEVLRLSLQAHNTGHANPGNDDGYMANYPDMCARMGEFYLAKNHMIDDVFTWTANHTGFPTSYPEPVRGGKWKENWTWFWQKQ